MAQHAHAADCAALGTFIRERRQALGLTQTELAARAGFVQERISLLEHGKYGTPSLAGLATLAEALEVPLSDLVGAAGYADAGASPSDLMSSSGDGRPRSGESVERLRHFMQESSRLAAGLEDLQVRLSATEEQLIVVEDLRQDLARRRQSVQEITAALLYGPDAGRPTATEGQAG